MPDKTVLIVGGSPHVRAAIADLDLVVRTAASVDEALPLLNVGSQTPQLVVLQSTAGRAAKEAETLLAASVGAQLVLLLPPDQLPRFRAGLPFMPRLGRAWNASEKATSSELAALISDATESERKRRQNDRVMARINASLLRQPVQDHPHGTKWLWRRYSSLRGSRSDG